MGEGPRKPDGGARLRERSAIEKAIAAHLAGLTRFLGRRAEGLVLERESASDLAQSVCREALERVATERLRFQGEAELKQWLYKAALLKISERRRRYLAQRRDAAREVRMPSQSGSRGLSRADFLRTLVTPSRVASAREDLSRLERAFDRLTEDQQRVITMSKVEGLSHQEIAERLGITEVNSRVTLSRALARLATLATAR
jgi:RNA polymerase sigma-70 factor (ECF subfamily)